MEATEVQMILERVGAYKGRIDGKVGPKTRAAISAMEKRHAGAYASRPGKWSAVRRMIGAGQAGLTQLGFEPGAIDGYAGHNTRAALADFMHERANGKRLVIERQRTGGRSTRTHPAQMHYPRQRNMPSFYGPAGGPQCTAGKVLLPISFVIDWNPRQKVKRFSCHQKLAEPMTRMFAEAVKHYGEKRFRELRLDRFGGCYNYRNKRGGRTLSTHAYGAAIDLDPSRNQLRWGADRAAFAAPEYEPFFAIAMAHGATPAGYAWGKDWMHFQWARL